MKSTKSTVFRVVLLLAFAAFLDLATGPKVTAAAFYMFPVALAGWKLGRNAGVVTSFGAGLLNLTIEWRGQYMAHLHPSRQPQEISIPLESVLHLLVFLVVCWLSIQLRQQQISLAEQRDELQRLNRQMEAEMRSARVIQQILTGPIPVHPAVEIQTHLQTARILGGDTVYLTLTPDDRLAIAVGDVSGKGSPAALAGAVLIGMLEESPSRFRSPSETLNDLNRRLAGCLPDEMFVTFFYGLLDLRTGDLVYSNAGHELPFLLSKSGAGEMLPSIGLPLGLFPETNYAEYRAKVRPDDLLFIYTDGLTDQRQANGERLSADRLFEMVGETRDRTCTELVKSVLERAVEGTGEVGDDISMVAIRYLAPRMRLNSERPLSAALTSVDRGAEKTDRR